jgi:hypothetical protein
VRLHLIDQQKLSRDQADYGFRVLGTRANIEASLIITPSITTRLYYNPPYWPGLSLPWFLS